MDLPEGRKVVGDHQPFRHIGSSLPRLSATLLRQKITRTTLEELEHSLPHLHHPPFEPRLPQDATVARRRYQDARHRPRPRVSDVQALQAEHGPGRPGAEESLHLLVRQRQRPLPTGEKS